MANSIPLKLYLATRARSERGTRRALARGDTPEDEKAQEHERLGHAGIERPDGPLIWIHSGQDRHALAARELANRLRAEREELNFLFTTSARARRDSEEHLISQFAPDEYVPAIRSFLTHWKPDLSIWTEPDVRPALAAGAAGFGVPLYLIDAHTAPTETQGWRFWPGVSSTLLTDFRHVITGDPVKAGALRRLGAGPAKTEIVGYLEEGTAALPCNTAERDDIAKDIVGRPVWLAGHAADAEIEPILDAHRQVLRRTHKLLLILVPDDPEAGPDLAKAIRDHGFTASLRSSGAFPVSDTQIYIADTEGEMGLWYRLAAVSYLGRSLEASGGVNPFEAAALGSAIIHGPNVRNYRRAYGRLASAGATRMVRNTNQLSEALEALLSPDIAALMAHEAWKLCTSGAEVTDRAMDLVLTELDEREPA
ncbi:3-deoxy-D-manno-octulosonic acid transferase [Pseudoruegeria sp. HB172150]|uniref:3-deoxy-D-manno-octulosonic acid transferase n=1 Tax=Pseudoruegeria sp. HB172150 TaxID=2721164 RepID=UPI001556471A|nr:glycosyltransferase N-terminal domain-containing protein [Pseudoruegeria sp. HB172150]